MKLEQQVEQIMDFCRDILATDEGERHNAYKKYLWKIEMIARNTRLFIEDGHYPEEDL